MNINFLSGKSPTFLNSLCLGAFAALNLIWVTHLWSFWLSGQMSHEIGYQGLFSWTWLEHQLTDPSSLFWSWVVVSVPFLAATIFVMRRNQSVAKALACGLGFAAPIVFVCSELPKTYGAFCLGRFECFAGITLIVSPLSLALAAFRRHITRSDIPPPQ
jgi:hypothetical protein